MKGCLILMPILFCGGSEKQVRLIVEGINTVKLPLYVIVESSDPAMSAEEKQFVKDNPNVSFTFLNTDAVSAKYAGKIKKYSTKLKSLWVLSQTVKRIVKDNDIDMTMITNLTGLVLVPLFNSLGCKIVYNERNPGVRVCNKLWKRKLLKKCYGLVCNSKYASKHMEIKLGCKVEVINNGILPMNITNSPINDEIFRIIVPARVSEVKNQKVVLDAIAILKGKLNVKVTFAGVVEDEAYYQRLDKSVHRSDISDKIEFIGFASNMSELYKRSNLLILPSLEEGTPNVLLEAFMCDLFVLASNIPMNADCIQDKECLFNPHNALELARKIEWALGLNKDDSDAIKKRNNIFVTQNYGIEKMRKKYIELLYSVQ